MLSADSAAALPHFDWVGPASDVVDTPPSLAHEKWGTGRTTILEGGFVANGPILMGGGTSQPVIDFDGTWDVTIEEILSQPGTWVSTGTDDSWMESDASTYSGFTPRVFGDGPYDFEFTWADPRGGSDSSLFAETNEGGMISVGPIFEVSPGGIHNVEHSLAEVPTRSLGHDALALSGPHSSSGSNVRDLTGEWARAAVFEVAGGQPVAVSLRASALPTAANVQQVSQAESGDADAMATMTAEERAAALQLQRVAEGQVERTEVDAPQGAEVPPTDGPSLTTAAVVRVTPVADLGGTLKNDVAGEASLAAPLNGLPEEAAAAAFAELGSAEPVAVVGAGDRLHLHSWLSGTPLLLMLALERVTARSARRRKTIEDVKRCS